jgi:ferric iron reductase protein FhuF
VSTAAAVPWREGLVAELGGLGPDIEGRVLAAAPPGAEVVPAERFHDSAFLRQAIVKSGESLLHAASANPNEGVMKTAAAASRFTRHYVGSMTASAIIGLARGVGFDLAADRCVKVVETGLPRKHLLPESDEGIVTCAERPASWQADETAVATVATVDDLRRYVWERLYAHHVGPLLAVVRDETPATARLLWSNAAEWVAYTADMAVTYMGVDDAWPIVVEARALLDAPALPGVDGPNPFTGLVEYVPVDDPEFPIGVSTRHHCCSTYMLPARTGFLCGNCPFLPLPERMALRREMRDTGGAVGGPAMQRSIEIGRQRLRTD